MERLAELRAQIDSLDEAATWLANLRSATGK